MKKVLFASTALVLSAGVASADGVTITGEAGFGITNTGGTTSVSHYLEYFLGASVATDSGITVGASSDLAVANSTSYTAAATVAAPHVTNSDSHDSEVYMSYEGLKLSVGNISSASDVGGFADIGYEGIGVDDVAEKAIGHAAADVRVDYSFGDIKVALSADSTAGSNQWAASVSGSFDAFTFALGFDDNGTANGSVVGLGYSAGAFSAKAHYEDRATTNAMGVHVAYTTGDVTVSAAYAERDTAGVKTDAYGVGVAYDLGGATLAAGFGEDNGTQKADLGISFEF